MRPCPFHAQQFDTRVRLIPRYLYAFVCGIRPRNMNRNVKNLHKNWTKEEGKFMSAETLAKLGSVFGEHLTGAKVGAKKGRPFCSGRPRSNANAGRKKNVCVGSYVFSRALRALGRAIKYSDSSVLLLY